MVLERVLSQFKIRSGEAEKVFLMAVYLLMAVSAFIIGRITRDALFLGEYDRSALVFMYMTVAVAVSIPSYLYARVADRYRRDRIVKITLIFFALSVVGLRVALGLSGRWIYIVLYNWIEVVGAFLMIQFWTFAGDIFSSRQAKRLFPIIGGGGVLANILCGATVSGLVKVIGTENLLLVLVACLAVCFGVVHRLGALEKPRLQEAITGRKSRAKRGAFKMRSELSDVFKSKHLRIVAAMTVATFVTVQFIDFQFKALTKSHFTIDGITQVDQLSSFYGVFFTITGVVAAVMQFGITGRLLERFGIVISLLILPSVLLVGSVGMVVGIASNFVASVFTKGAENSMRYSVYDATMQVIYMPVPSHERGRAKSFIDGILKPGAMGFAGLALWFFVARNDLPVHHLSFVALILTGLWIALILSIRREYVAQLLASLRRRRLDFSSQTLVINDDATVETLRRAMSSPEAPEVRNALELVGRVVGRDLADDLIPLLERPEEDIRVKVLELLGGSRSLKAATQAQALFQSDSQQVKSAAIRAYTSIMGDRALQVVQAFLASDAAEVRAAAVASLIQHGGLDGILLSAEHLKAMIESEKDDERLMAARVLRDIGVKNFYQPVLRLMNDKSPRVQNAAIQAAGTMRSPELVPALVYKLSYRETMRQAGLALSRYGEGVVDTLRKVIHHEPEDVLIRRQVPRILERVGSRVCLDILLDALEVGDPDTRREAARCAARLRERLGVRIDENRIQTVIKAELEEYYQQLAALSDLDPISGQGGPDLIRDALKEQLERKFELVFRLLGIIYPLKSIELIQFNLASPNNSVRANAVEVLDNLLDKNAKRFLLPLLEEIPPERILERGDEFFEIARKKPQDWLKDFLNSPETWLLVATLHVVGELGLTTFEETICEHLRHPHPVARETAARTLSCLQTPARFIETCGHLLEDRDLSVRRYVTYLMDQAKSITGQHALPQG
jgi:ATP/ADP translocase